MVKFTIEELHKATNKRSNIRNISIIAHVDSGKSTITDSLLNRSGLVSDENTGERRVTDTRADEQERCITIKSTGVSLHYEIDDTKYKIPEDAEGNSFLINLIDSPGHVDFSSEVTAALRITDGAVVVLDGVKGVAVQTETVLKQALDEMVVPVGYINKLDRLILELKLDAEELYQKLYNHVVALNACIAKHNHKFPEIELKPQDNNIAFGCGIMGWGFTLHTWAQLFADKVGMTKEEMIPKLWGENYFNPKTKEWTTEKVKNSYRGFNYFCIMPMMNIINTVKTMDLVKIKELGSKLKLSLKDIDMKTDKEIMKMMLMQYIPNADALLEMIVTHLPSPVKAQKYRVDHIYTGPKDDPYYRSIHDCDPDGALIMYISKLVPSPDLSRFYAFGRVFGGTVKSGMVHILGPDYVVGEKNDLFPSKRIQQVNIMMAAKAESVEYMSAGNTCALSGIDKFIVKTCTIVDGLTHSTLKDAHIIRDMKFAVSPVVSVAVSLKDPSKIAELTKAVTLLSKSDPLCVIRMNKDTGELVISGAGELHLEICIQDLREMYLPKGVEIVVSDPVVPFRETVDGTSSQTCLSKSPNKHNRLYMSASSIDNDILMQVDKLHLPKNIDEKEKKNKVSPILSNSGWNKEELSKIWSITEVENMNIMVDCTKAVQYLNEIKSDTVAGFNSTVCEMGGPLCGEPVYGVRINLHDVVLHADAIHRGGGQIIPTVRRCVYASMLTANPRLMEPIYAVHVECPSDVVSKVYSVINQRKGEIINEEHDTKSDGVSISGYLPVSQSIGFTQFLRQETQGRAFPQCTFSHWQIINDDPLTEGTRSNQIMKDVQKRKGYQVGNPDISKYMDKL